MLFGSSGIRRLYTEELLTTAVRCGFAVGDIGKTAAVGRDCRTSGQLLMNAFISGCMSCGTKIYDGGIVPTPTAAYAGRNTDFSCCITASHNPEEYNGIKLLNPDGSAFTKKQQSETEEKIFSYEKCFSKMKWESQGTVVKTDMITPHIEKILSLRDISRGADLVLDCGSGAGSVITPLLLKEAGINAHCINCTPSGKFARPSEPLESNLPYIHDMILKTKSAGAVIHDGDADRFMGFDEKGRWISGDQMLMLFAEYLGVKKIVTTSDASMAVEEFAEVRRTPVGDSYVSEELISWGEFGAEPSGAWIFPEISLCPDGIYAAGLFSEIASENKVSEMIDAMPKYPVLRESYPCAAAKEVLTDMGADVPTDGIRISGENGWVLIRASGTEPKVRITAEGKTDSDARVMKEKGLELFRKSEKKFKH